MNHDNPLKQDTPINHDTRNQWRAIISPPLDIEPFHPLSSAMALEIAADSVRGKWRAHNTDHYLALRTGRLRETLITSLAAADLPPRFEEYAYSMLVADGLSEDAGGARASRVALSALAHLYIEYGKWNVRVNVDTMGDIVQEAEFLSRRVNDAVIEASRAHAELGDMATSLTAAYVAEDDLFLFHVGHSRAYLFRDGILTQVTATHTLDTHRPDGSRPTRLQRARQDSQTLRDRDDRQSDDARARHGASQAVRQRPLAPLHERTDRRRDGRSNRPHAGGPPRPEGRVSRLD